MSIKHTPAPWRLSGVDVVNGDDHWCINGHSLVTGLHSPTDCRLATVYSIEANARLIAAAPELLEALDEMVRWYAKRETASMFVSGGEGLLPIEAQDEEVQQAIRAIAKATGGES